MRPRIPGSACAGLSRNRPRSADLVDGADGQSRPAQRLSGQALRDASFQVAITLAEEIGDVRRFDTPRQLTLLLGLVRAEARPARPCAARTSPWPAIAAPAGCWSTRLGLSLPG